MQGCLKTQLDYTVPQLKAKAAICSKKWSAVLSQQQMA
jgi:hypothetical protein